MMLLRSRMGSIYMKNGGIMISWALYGTKPFSLYVFRSVGAYHKGIEAVADWGGCCQVPKDIFDSCLISTGS